MYYINDEKIFHDTVDNRTLVINSETGIYYGISNVASDAFNFLICGYHPEKIAAALKSLPDAPADIEQRFEKFIEELKNLEILVCGKSNDGEVSFIQKVTNEDPFSFNIITYADAQEMLLADPIDEQLLEFGGKE